MKTALQRAFVAQTILERNLFPPLAVPAVFRPYRDNDYESCIAIYRKNEPGRFPEAQIPVFEHFLRHDAKTCIIAELDSKVVACGGLMLHAFDLATLCYGLVDPEFQGLQIGSTLTLLRIALVPLQPEDIFFVIYAVDLSMPFYRRFGFAEAGRYKAPDGKDYPIGLLRVSYREMHRIKSALDQRNIRVHGDLAHPAPDGTGEVVYGPKGPQFVFHARNAAPKDVL